MPLAPEIEAQRVQVIACLRTINAIRCFSSVEHLVEQLERGLDKMVKAGLPRALTRVVLFTRHKTVVLEVARRMAIGADFMVYPTPDCWPMLGARLPELRALAERIEPGWLAQTGGATTAAALRRGHGLG